MTIRRKFWIAAAALLMAACGSRKEGTLTAEDDGPISMEQNMPGDSTVYGLACDGCNDTILVFLSRTDGDPDTFNILNASKAHQVFGHPMIGDKLAIMVNSENPKVADLVVDIEQLRGEWCYMVQPKLRERAGFNQATLKREMTPELDSVLQQLLQPREYGVEIKSGYTAQPIGAVRSMTSDEESPVEYPPLKRYREWRIFNGRLILSETSRDTLGNTTVTNSDTATFVLLRRDSLVLRIGDEERGYYRRLASELSD